MSISNFAITSANGTRNMANTIAATPISARRACAIIGGVPFRSDAREPMENPMPRSLDLSI